MPPRLPVPKRPAAPKRPPQPSRAELLAAVSRGSGDPVSGLILLGRLEYLQVLLMKKKVSWVPSGTLSTG